MVWRLTVFLFKRQGVTINCDKASYLETLLLLADTPRRSPRA